MDILVFIEFTLFYYKKQECLQFQTLKAITNTE